MITKEMKGIEVLNLGEAYENVFSKYLLTCAGCSGALTETLEEAAKGHGISIEDLLYDLNRV